MRDKSFSYACALLSALSFFSAPHTAAGKEPTNAPGTAPPIPQWKFTPEDSTTWKREPFKKTEGAQKTPQSSAKSAFTSSDVVLQGILKSNARFYAIINGTTVKSGDRIDGWTVAQISRHRVILRRDKETQIQDIYQGKIDRGTR